MISSPFTAFSGVLMSFFITAVSIDAVPRSSTLSVAQETANIPAKARIKSFVLFIVVLVKSFSAL
jgi:hypothetical protein